MHQRQAMVMESGRVASDQQLMLKGLLTEPHQQFWKNCAKGQDLRLDH
jgi:hypothetical protein